MFPSQTCFASQTVGGKEQDEPNRLRLLFPTLQLSVARLPTPQLNDVTLLKKGLFSVLLEKHQVVITKPYQDHGSSKGC